MSARVRFSLLLVIVLAALSAVGWVTVNRTTLGWFERDVSLRSDLVIKSARRGLTADVLRGDVDSLQRRLSEIAVDQHILAAAVCAPDLKLIASTPEFSNSYSCAAAGEGIRPGMANGAGSGPWQPWRTIVELSDGRVHVSATPLLDNDKPVAFVVLLQDLSFVDLRAEKAERFLLLVVAVLSLLAVGATLIAMRISWRKWNAELQRLARGESGERSRAFVPVLKDLRDLLDRLATEEESDQRGGAWTPERLKLALQRHLHGERIIVVANREPYVHMRNEDGTVSVQHPASGLVTALEPVMRACSGVWVAHGSGTADRESSDAQGRVRMPPGEESYWVRRVWLSEEEEKGYYYGTANEGLWPLCHVAHTRPTFRIEDWKQYQAVNQKFADAVLAEVDRDDPVILVQDYHFALLPQILRAKLPRATIITFWHIPWPNAEQLGICPWHEELLQGLLGSSILGFHTQYHCNNFLDAADRYLESRIDREDQAVVQHQRSTLVRAYPISVEWPSQWVAKLPSVAECRAEIFARFNLPADGLLGVGVDRLDYTKGIEERILAVERLFERFPEFIGRFTFLQAASPSRTLIERYGRLNRDVEALVHRVNSRFGREGWLPVRLRREHTEPLEVFRYYRAADLCYISSVHDGMNLVAKEYVSAHDDERGVLLLSRFTGAARELTEALLVNPYDLEEASSALATALRMPIEEQGARMRAMRRLLAEYNVYRWAGRMLLDAGRLRRREQLVGRITTDWADQLKSTQ